MLKKLGIVKSKTKGYHVFMDSIEPDFLHNTMCPSEYVNYCWEKYTTSGVPQNNSLNGTVFELIIATLFVKEVVLSGICLLAVGGNSADSQPVSTNNKTKRATIINFLIYCLL